MSEKIYWLNDIPNMSDEEKGALREKSIVSGYYDPDKDEFVVIRRVFG